VPEVVDGLFMHDRKVSGRRPQTSAQLKGSGAIAAIAGGHRHVQVVKAKGCFDNRSMCKVAAEWSLLATATVGQRSWV
jgi:hypothetical protein